MLNARRGALPPPFVTSIVINSGTVISWSPSNRGNPILPYRDPSLRGQSRYSQPALGHHHPSLLTRLRRLHLHNPPPHDLRRHHWCGKKCPIGLLAARIIFAESIEFGDASPKVVVGSVEGGNECLDGLLPRISLFEIIGVEQVREGRCRSLANDRRRAFASQESKPRGLSAVDLNH